MFQQLINLMKLEAVTNFCICVAEQNILEICKSVSYEVFKNSLLKFIRRPITCLMFLIVLESNFLLDYV